MSHLYYSHLYSDGISPEARFPRLRYRLTREELITRGVLSAEDFLTPNPVRLEDLQLVHDAGYVTRFLSGTLSAQEIRRIGLRPWTEAIIERTCILTGAAVMAVHDVCNQLAFYAGNLAGGTHHAHHDYGSGYCVFNDIAVGAAVAMRDYGLTQIAVFDLDVHQGDGTATIFQDDPRVFTLSIHCQQNFPFRKQSSDLDIGVDEGMGDEAYLSLLRETLPGVLERVKPELVFFQAGVDPLQSDRLGRLMLSREGLQERNRYVFDLLDDAKLPAVVVMGGGYSPDIEKTVACHADLYEAMLLRNAARSG